MSDENKKVVENDFVTIQELVHTEDFEEPNELYNRLIEKVKVYHPSSDISMIEKAYQVAFDLHKEQKRKSGEPYIIHPLCVALILADLELDKESIISGLLHDVVEDTAMSDAEVRKEFGDEVALIVDGVTKLSQLSYNADKLELQAENLRKMFLAMSKDIRVILVKLADRLHNMRTLKYMSPEKQKEKARETMDIYSPLAQRLGISKVKVELDDLALSYLEPDAYHELARQINLQKDEREALIASLVKEVKDCVEDGGVKTKKVYGRVKHFFSIYKKMVNQHKTLDEIYDLFAVRIIVDSVKDCYAALGLIHGMYKPIPGRIKDYIAMPKSNMYQSLHTTVVGSNGKRFEIQIRTEEMHRIAEYGIAAHWKYKEAPGSKNIEDSQEAKLTWLRQILEWQTENSDNKEFMNIIKSDLDLFSDTVYCFTPEGDVKSFPTGSTAIDFAYSIHSAVGNKMVGARINGKLVPITQELKNGDQVSIITSNNSKGPSKDWLKHVKTGQARNKINQWFRAQNKEENTIKGKESLQRYCKDKGIVLSEILKQKYMEKTMRKYSFLDWDSVCAAVGHGGLKEGQVINKLQEEYRKDHPIEPLKIVTMKDGEQKLVDTSKDNKKTFKKCKKNSSGVTVKGLEDSGEIAIRLSKCCNPLPGDDIVGFITRNNGITVHRTDCSTVLHLSDEERRRMIEVDWIDNDEKGELFNVDLTIYSYNQLGTMLSITQIFTENNISLSTISSRVNKQKDKATTEVSFEIDGKRSLKKIIDKLTALDGVYEVTRTKG